jgi:hypothetical protein
VAYFKELSIEQMEEQMQFIAITWEARNDFMGMSKLLWGNFEISKY